MKLPRNKLLLFMLIFIYSFTYANANVCCYDGADIFYSGGDLCPTGSTNLVSLGGPDTGSGLSPDQFCHEYKETRQGCMRNNQCYQTALSGKIIYSFSEFSKSTFDQVCESYRDDWLTCIDGDAPTGNIGGGGDGTGDDSSNPGQFNFSDELNQTSNFSEETEFCSAGGGQFQLFVTKDSCESIEISGDNSCIFNPYLAGFFKSTYSDFSANLLFPFENSCVPKTEIKECFDYKLKDNCVNNRANLSSKLANGCRWIEASDYTPSSGINFNDNLGICVSNPVDGQVGLEKSEYLYRKNLIKNPSFEISDDTSWSLGLSTISTDSSSYHGSKFLSLGSNGIAQKIVNILPSNSFATQLYARVSDLNVENSITTEILSFDSDGNQVDTFNSTINLNPLFENSEEGVFKKVRFSDFSISPESDVDYLILMIRPESGNSIDIDALTLEPFSRTRGDLNPGEFFKPTSIIPKEASICDSCYDPLKFNICTEKKANYLGDCTYLSKYTQLPYESDLDTYTGSEDNIYMGYDKKWESQALANSQLFCELYVHNNFPGNSNEGAWEGACEYPENYLNNQFTSLHPNAGDTLCKWSDSYGCFKDSNNDDEPDTRSNYPRFSILSDVDYFGLDYERSAKPVEGIYSSDFALACDTLPPISYIYLTGTNVDGINLSVTGDSFETIGNAIVNLDARDDILQSCQGFDIFHRLYIDYEIQSENGNTNWFRQVESNQLANERYPVKEYFLNSSDDLAISDGLNNISIFVMDQSGNKDKVWDFQLDLDVNPPEINLIDPVANDYGVISSYLTVGSIFQFEITDYSELDYCEYHLTPLGDIDPSYYNHNTNGTFRVDDFEADGITYNLDLEISNSSVSGDSYILTVDCRDVFNQIATKNFAFTVDARTEVVIINPKPFVNSTFMHGYINESKNVTIISADRNLNSCKFDFEGYDLTSPSDLDIGTIFSEPFTHPDFEDVNFFYNVTGTLDFASVGRKEGKIICDDTNGNVFEDNIVYYYDNIAPSLEDFKLVENSVSNVSNVYVDEYGTSYLRDEIAPAELISLSTYYSAYLNLTIDGTNSWIDNFMEFSYMDDDGVIDSIASFDPELDITISNSTTPEDFIGSATGLMSIYDVIYEGIDQEDNNLYKVKLNAKFKDKAGNYGTGPVEFYVDKSYPAFNFSGDIVNQNSMGIFTNAENPTFEVSFNSPAYRTFSCYVTASWDNNGLLDAPLDLGPNIPITAGSTISFSLDDLSTQIHLDQNVPLPITLDCTDLYNRTLTGTFDLYYDNVEPQLNTFYWDKGNTKYLRSFENKRQEDVIDSLVFDLEETGEVYYSCNYQIESNVDYYVCNSSWFHAEFTDSGIKTSEPINILSSNSDSGAICVRNLPVFDPIHNREILTNAKFNTELRVNTYCNDGAMLNTEPKSLITDINYVDSDLAEFVFEYADGYAYPIVKSFVNFPSVKISFSPTGSNSIVTLSEPSYIDGFYVYESLDGFSLENYDEGILLTYAVPIDAADNAGSSIMTRLIIDKTLPEAQMLIPDENGGEIYSSEFEILTEGIDVGGRVDKVELLLNGSLIYNSEDEFVDLNYLRPLETNKIIFDGEVFNGEFIYYNASLGDILNFEFIVYDMGGNKDSVNITLEVKDGVSITLLDSFDALVHPTRLSWITKSSAPVISFETSKIVDYCNIYPMGEKKWEAVTGNSRIRSASLDGPRNVQSFTFDLSTLPAFDLTNVPDQNSKINILCHYNESFYNYTRTLNYIDYLPDYVLESSNGFVLNEDPYLTIINVKSVGPYRYINCEYSFNGETKEFLQEDTTRFSASLNFSGLEGDVEVGLACRDLLGTLGPQKSYTFSVAQDEPLELFNLSLIVGQNEFFPNANNEIYINDLETEIKFFLNKKTDLTCSYLINQNTVFGDIIRFFQNLFRTSRTDIEPLSPYEFRANGLVFGEGENTLEVDCQKNLPEGGSQSVALDYTVIYSERNLSIDASRTGIE